MKHFNPPSVASATGKESQHNISGLSSFFGNLQSMMSYQQIKTPQLCSPSNTHRQAASTPTTTAQKHQQQPVQLQPPLHHCTCLQLVLFRTTAVKHLKVLFRTTQTFQKQFSSCMFKKNPNTRSITLPNTPKLKKKQNE